MARVTEIPEGQRKIIEIEGRSIGVFNVNGTFYALRNLCPHQLAPLCEGRVLGTTLASKPGEYILGREGEILRCPWHGWEFDIKTGRSLFNPHTCRVRSYDVTTDDAPPKLEKHGDMTAEDTTTVETFPVTLQDAYIVVHV